MSDLEYSAPHATTCPCFDCNSGAPDDIPGPTEWRRVYPASTPWAWHDEWPTELWGPDDGLIPRCWHCDKYHSQPWCEDGTFSVRSAA